ncbi:hypothetical protein HDV57DRAFT_445981 [Trichoderma longibrachiatum]
MRSGHMSIRPGTPLRGTIEHEGIIILTISGVHRCPKNELAFRQMANLALGIPGRSSPWMNNAAVPAYRSLSFLGRFAASILLSGITNQVLWWDWAPNCSSFALASALETTAVNHPYVLYSKDLDRTMPYRTYMHLRLHLRRWNSLSQSNRCSARSHPICQGCCVLFDTHIVQSPLHTRQIAECVNH